MSDDGECRQIVGDEDICDGREAARGDLHAVFYRRRGAEMRARGQDTTGQLFCVAICGMGEEEGHEWRAEVCNDCEMFCFGCQKEIVIECRRRRALQAVQYSTDAATPRMSIDLEYALSRQISHLAPGQGLATDRE